MPAPGIKSYDPKAFTTKFMPSEELHAKLKGDVNKFLIVRVEDMYRHVTQAVPPSRSHTHTCIYLTAGEAYMHIGGRKYTIRRNEMLFVPAGQIFSFEAYDNSKFNKGYLCTFHNEILAGKFGKSDLLKDLEFLRIWGNPCLQLDKQTSKFALHLFKRIVLEYTTHGLAHLDIIQPYFITLLCEVNRCYKAETQNRPPASVKIANAFRELLFTHARSKHLATDYAAMLNVSPNHLNKAVKAATNKPVTRWIDEAIILEAKVLLSQSDIPVHEIAAAVGFEDPSYFTRLFKRYEQLTPTAFRRMIEKS